LTARVEGCLWDKRLVEDKKARSVGELEESVATAPQMQMAYARLFFFGGGLVRISSLRVLSSRMLAHMLLAEQVIMGSGSLHKG